MYDAVQSTEERIEQYLPLVERIAFHLMARLPDTVQVEDLIQAGVLGLMEAFKNYDGTKGAAFETYASIRIRGYMLDELRKTDWAPRSVHKKSRMISEAIRNVENRTGQYAKDSEIAEFLGIELSEYHQMLQDISSCRMFSTEEINRFDDETECFGIQGENPAETLFNGTLKEALVSEISSLPEKERLVVSLYYDEELNLKEIGQVLGVSESRVSQINSQAMQRLRARLSSWLETNDV